MGHQSMKTKASTSLLQNESGEMTTIQNNKTKRQKGMKYFTKVGYTQSLTKQIPRWCTDMDMLNRVVLH